MTAELVTEIVGGETYQYYPLGEYVVRAVGVCGGRPTFKYTRIEIAGALDRLAAGESVDAIVKGYRGRVSREAMMEAVRGESAIAHQFSGQKVAEILKLKRGSIKQAQLPKGSPSWDEFSEMTWDEIEGGAKANEPGFRVIRKLLTDKRFDR